MRVATTVSVLLSIRTVFPRRGARIWYEDQREAHRQIYAREWSADCATARGTVWAVACST